MCCSVVCLPVAPQVAFTKEGKLQAIDMQLYCNAGYSLDIRWGPGGVWGGVVCVCVCV